MRKHLLPLLTPKSTQDIYVEVFGGSGVILLNKLSHTTEVYNDLNGDLANLFRCLRDPESVIRLWWKLIGTPVSRQEYGAAIRALRVPMADPIERAAAFVVSCRQGFGGFQDCAEKHITDRNWGTARSTAGGVNSQVHRWLNVLLTWPEIHARLAGVVIDQQDAARCVSQWDTPSTLFYVDPPYVGTEDYYQGGFGEADHERLAGVLNGIQGRAVLSYYPCALVDRLYPKDRWQRTAVKTYSTACGNGPRDPNGKAQAVKAIQQRTELILTNFDPGTRKRLGLSAEYRVGMGRK